MCSRLRENVTNFYECYCEVSEGRNGPYLVRHFPENYKNEDELKSVPIFTYPCDFDKTYIQHFSFVLTSSDSKWTFGFCRHDPKTTTALVVLSHLPWHDHFYKFLNAIASLSQMTWSELKEFLNTCRAKPPPPGHKFNVSYSSGQSIFSYQSLEFQLPAIPENCNLTEYFSAVDPRGMVGIWAALLSERRIAVIASKPARLSAAVQAANATLYPMSWQHIYIPILPKQLSDYLLAPMPFLIGVPRAVMENVRTSDIGDVVILDADKSVLHSPFNDVEALPFEVVAGLKRALRDKNVLLGDTVSRAFLRALVRLIGGYRDALRIEHGKRITFNPEAFLKTRRPSMRPFLKKILELQIFQQFIEERLDLLNAGLGFSDEFELECTRYAEKGSEGMKQQYHQWVKTMRRESGALLKTVRDKANPAVKSAVNSVQKGGRGVKTAVQGLKIRMLEGTSSGHHKSWRPSSANVKIGDRQTHEYLNAASSEGSTVSLESLTPPDKPTSWDLSNIINEVDNLFLSKEDNATTPSSVKELAHLEENMVLPPKLPPRPSTSYTIVPTTSLIDITEAPMPPPRLNVDHKNRPPTFISHITKDMENVNFVNHNSRGPMHLSQSDNGHTKLTATSSLQSVTAKDTAKQLKKSPPEKPPRPSRNSEVTYTKPKLAPKPNLGSTAQSSNVRNSKVLHSATQEAENLIFLDEPITDGHESLKPLQTMTKPVDIYRLEDFDPLQVVNPPCRSAAKVFPAKSPGESELLKEYGLDFSQFGLVSPTNNNNSNIISEPISNKKSNWTTFN